MTQLRIDIYLKLMGVFKTRSIAGKACKGGYVSMADKKVKSSYTVSGGNLFEIVKPDGGRIALEVIGIPSSGQVSRKDRQDYCRIVGIED